jgi:tryptophan-rich sensory protein
MKQGIKFFYVFFAVMLTAYICSVFTNNGISQWYDNIEKPFLTPPNKVFPIAWAILYVLIIISTFIALKDADSYNRKKANNYFILQLFLQILWCFTFFAEGHLGLGFAIILLLDIAVFKMIGIYSKINKTASYMLYPYYWWLLFATFMNFNFVYNFGLVMVL